MPIIVWFRRDLRIHDHSALFHACADSADGVIPIFVFDDAILKHPDCGGPIVQFMLGCIGELRQSLRAAGGDLILLHGRPGEQISRLAKQVKASAVYFNKDYAPGALQRDENIAFDLPKLGVNVRQFKDQVIYEEDEILSKSTGTPYTIYTPYRKAWEAKFQADGFSVDGPPVLARPKLKFPASIRTIKSIELPTTEQLGFTCNAKIEIPAGESAARSMLKAFCAEPLQHYKLQRNFPALPGSSRLSPHLRHGTLSPRQCIASAIHAAKQRGQSFDEGATTWISELIWRDFYQQILYHFPHVQTQPFKKQYDTMRWPESDEMLEKWKTGQTGYPIVDAAMRQLNSTGWMHNRLRMISAMFLTKDLLIDYRLGERYFMQNLIDGETAQNNGGWQWSSSTGTDAQPYFRVFNPIRQSESFDPQGVFIRTYCPELSQVTSEYIHAPWEMPREDQESTDCIIGRQYPAPCVNHLTACKQAVNFFKTFRR